MEFTGKMTSMHEYRGLAKYRWTGQGSVKALALMMMMTMMDVLT
jgi:hypothetical protein